MCLTSGQLMIDLMGINKSPHVFSRLHCLSDEILKFMNETLLVFIRKCFVKHSIEQVVMKDNNPLFEVKIA